MAKMAKKFLIGAAAATLAGAFLFACSSSTGPSDEENLRDLVDGRYAAYFNDGAAYGGKPPGGDGSPPARGRDAEATLPIHWWRTVTYAKRTVYVTLEAPYTQAQVVVKDDIRGLMYIDRSDNKTLDPGSKPFEVVRTRHATFVRASTGDPWELTAISPAVYSVKEQGRQTITITSVRVVTAGGYDRTFEDMEEQIPLGKLPKVNLGETVTVTVKAKNASREGWVPESFCFLHHDWQRHDMTERSDDVFKGEYRITAEPGVRHGGASAIDAGTLQNEAEDDYNADGWSLPFIVS
jgi:hypothetical protein